MGYGFGGQNMKYSATTTRFLPLLAAAVFWSATSPATTLDTIGVTALRAMTTNLDGRGIRVAQPEAIETAGTTNFEVNPGDVGRPAGLFTYISAGGSTNNFPNALGGISGHAGNVGNYIYGIPYGVATNVAQVDNYNAEYFVTNYVFNVVTNDFSTNFGLILAPLPAATPVVNQSFTFGNVTTNLSLLATNPNYLAVGDQQEIDLAYDDYAVNYGTLFVSAVNNGGSVSPPGTGYNCIGVGAYGGSSSIGPTLDNGRCKPDLTAPEGATSYSTPQVTGAAAVLVQAALRGDGGGDTNAAADLRTVKALLLNGAVKPADWTNSGSSPLDARYGAGVVNVLNAYEQLAGGKQIFCASNSVALGAGHPPPAVTNAIAAGSGWDFENLSSSATNDAACHYFFEVSNVMATATLVWNRQSGATNINNLDLFLFNAADSNLVACSTSLVDNVEHLFVPQLGAGRYDLQVWKAGGGGLVSAGETYALAWQFVPPPRLAIAKSGADAALAWPVYPAGFRAEARTNLLAGAWSTNNLPTNAVTGSTNILQLPMTNALQFFRLRSPSF